jgi:anti-anti-sigma factor
VDIELAEHGSVTVVTPKGNLERADSDALKSSLVDLVRTGRRRLIIDLARVRYIDSGGLAALVTGMKEARAAGGDLSVCGLQPDVRIIFEMTRLIAVLATHLTRHEALAACA